MERKKTCVQSNKRKKGGNLEALAYNSKCVGEESEARRKQLTVQRKVCMVQGCPSNFRWTAWSHWSSCHMSCGEVRSVLHTSH